MKWWCLTESERLHITANGVFSRIKRGYYPNLKKRYVNKRVVFVQKEP